MSIRADLITSSEKEKKNTSHNVIYPTIIELNERDLMLMKLFQVFASWAMILVLIQNVSTLVLSMIRYFS